MKRLSDYQARWDGRTLHLTLQGQDLTVTELEVSPERVLCPGHSCPVETLTRIAGRRGQNRNHGNTRLMYLELRFTGPGGFQVPTSPGPQHDELLRILRLWQHRADVRDAWGTPALDALLVPALDDEQLARWRATRTADGLVVGIHRGANPTAIFGCLGGLLLPVVFMGSVLLQSGTGSAAFLGLFGCYVLFYPATLLVLALLSQHPVRGELILGHRGLSIRGRHLAWGDVLECHAEAGGLRIRTAAGVETLIPSYAKISELAALIDHHKQTANPQAVPRTLQQLREDASSEGS